MSERDPAALSSNPPTSDTQEPNFNSKHVVAIGLIALVLCNVLIVTGVPVLATLGAIDLLILPGIGVAYLLGLLRCDWRSVLLGATASVSFVPLLMAVLWNHVTTQHGMLLVLDVVCVILLALIAWRKNCFESADGATSKQRGNIWYIVILVWAAVTVLCTFALPQLPAPYGRQVVAIGDYVKHHAMLMTLEEERLPLRSPFYAAAADETYHYYHYAYFWPAALRQVSGSAMPRGVAIGIFAAVTAVGLICATYELTLRFCSSAKAATIAAACVSVIGGLDVVMHVFRVVGGAAMPAVMDSWIASPWRLHNLGTQFVWCPQHVAALLPLVFAALLVRDKWNGWLWLIVTPLVCVAIFGMSAFVSMTALPAIAISGAIVALGRSRNRMAGFATLVGIAAISLALMWPQLQGYLAAKERVPGGFTTKWPRMEWALVGRVVPPGVVANWLDAPWTLLVEFGIALLALLFASRGFWRAAWAHAGIRAILIAGVAGVIATYTVHNSAHDFVYGFRVCAMALTVVGAMAAGAFFDGGFARRAKPAKHLRAALVVTGFVGLSIGLLEMPYMAFRSLLARPNANEAAAARFVREELPVDAVLQPGVDRAALLQLIERRFGVADPADAHVQVFTPAEPERMLADCDAVTQAFASANADAAHLLLSELGVEYVWIGGAEREICGECGQFDDAARFDVVFANDDVTIVKLIESLGEQQE